MAVEIATAYVNLVPSARGFSTKLGRDLAGPLTRAGKDMGAQTGEHITEGIRGKLSGASKILGIAMATGLAGAGLAVGALGVFGIKAAASFQQTRIAFEGILGSAGRADKFLGEMRKFAAKTPFEFPELADAAKNLLAVGFAAKDVIPTMTTLGNVAATLGVGAPEIQGVVRALGQMKGKGKASAEELQQISEQLPGFSAIQAIADDMGVSVAQAFEQMSKGAIPADQAIQAILAGMQKFPGAAGAMARQSLTLNGVLSTFKDTMRDTLVNAFEPLLPTMSAALTKVTPLLQQTLNSVVGAVAPILPVLLTAVTQIVGAIAPLVGTLTKTLAPILTDFAGAFADTFEAIGPIFEALSAPIAAVAGAFVGVLKALVPLGPPIGQLVAAIAPLVAGFAEVAVTIAQALFPLVKPLVELLTEMATAFIGTATAPGPLLEILGVLGDAFKAVGSALLPVIVQIARQVGPVFSEAASVLSGAFGAALKEIVPAIGSLFASLVPLLPVIAQLAADLLTGLAPVLPELAKAFSDLALAVAPLLPQLLELAIVLIDKIGIPTIVALATALGALATAMTPLLTNTKVLTPLVFGLGGAFAAVKGIKALRTGILGIAKAGGTAVGTFQRLAEHGKSFFSTVGTGASHLRSFATGMLEMGRSALIATAHVAKSVAVFVAQKVAMLAAAVAQKALTAAQWLLNVAMTANPIGLIVAGIAALVAGAVLAYKKFKPFRDIVDAVGRAFRAAFNWIRDNWPLVLGIITGPFGLAVLAVKAHWSKITGFARAAFDWIKRNWPLLLAILTGPIGLAALTIAKHWNTISDGVKSVWRFVHENFQRIVNFITGLPAKIANAAAGMWNGIGDAFKGVLNFIIRAWNSLEFKIPGFDPPGPGPKFGGFTLGVPDIPELAGGAVITEPTFALLGETAASRPEIVAPEALLKKLLAEAGTNREIDQHVTYELNVQSLDPATAAPLIIRALQKFTKDNGAVPRVRVTG